MKTSLGFALAFAGLSLGCAPPTTEPQFPSSAGQVSYAQEYPAAMQSLSNEQANAESQIHTLSAEFAKYPDALKDPPWPQVQAIVSAADQAGRSAGYYEKQRSAGQVQEFFTSEKDEITRKVAGSVQYVAKKKEYELDVYGTVGASLKDAVDKQLEKRLRASNDAHMIIDRYRDGLGKNAAVLEKQADNIVLASYLANTALPMVRHRADKLVKEGDQARATLDKAIQDEQAVQAEAGRTPAEKKASQERQTRLQGARNRIDDSIAQSQAMLKDLEKRNAAVKKEYQDAFEALNSAIDAKASAAKK